MPDAVTIAEAIGYEGMALIVFAETAILVGFLLPGDAVILAAGALSAEGVFDLWLVIPVLIAAAVAGEGLAYVVGRRAGPWLRRRDRLLVLKRRHVLTAERFYDSHGAAAIVLARWVGVVRTFAPVAAGAAKMPRTPFVISNVLGGTAWVVSMVFAGYAIALITQRLSLAFAIILALVSIATLLPVAVAWWRSRRAGAAGNLPHRHPVA